VLSRRPDVVVSGINRGGNLGEDVLYSGTVSAAMEGTLLGIPSVAVSLLGRDEFDFGPAARFTVRLVRHMLATPLPQDTLLNVNVPALGRPRGYTFTRLGKRYFSDAITEKTDPRGKKYYWIGGDMERWVGGEDSDFHTVEEGRISITPLHLDMTNHSSIDDLANWKIR
jgi:5'-nucleotidase